MTTPRVNGVSKKVPSALPAAFLFPEKWLTFQRHPLDLILLTLYLRRLLALKPQNLLLRQQHHPGAVRSFRTWLRSSFRKSH